MISIAVAPFIISYEVLSEEDISRGVMRLIYTVLVEPLITLGNHLKNGYQRQITKIIHTPEYGH